MEDINWNLFYLRDNPFMIAPPEDREHLFWAGMPAPKREIAQQLNAARQTATTQVILNRGPFGGGKTHAMRYYSFLEHWPRAKNGVRDTHVFTIATPKQTGNPAGDFYVDVLERIDMSHVREVVRAAIEEVGELQGLRRLKEIAGSDSLARAILMLGQSPNEGSPNGKLFDSTDTAEYNRLLDQYFLEGCTKGDLRKLGLARNIDKAQDQFRVLAAVIHCFIGLIPGREVTNHSRFCLWVDEMEDFVYFTATQYRPFTQGLRDLIDKLPGFFTLFLNFTLTDPEEFETIEIIMGRALVDRITDNIIFSEMTIPQAVKYVDDLIANWRTENTPKAKLSPHFPFEDDALEYILRNLDKRTPRSINKRCSKVAESALRDDKRKSVKPGQIRIDLEFVKSLTAEELEHEFE